jgi:hypothetical protein
MIESRLDILGMSSEAGLWYIFIILGFIGGTAGISYLVFKHYRKEKTIKSILEKVVKEPITPNYQFFEMQPLEDTAPYRTQVQQIDQNNCDASNGIFDPPYQMYAGQFEGFTLVLLYRVFSFILQVFPSLELVFPREDRLNQAIKIKAFPPKEQVSFFRTLLGIVPDNEIRIELDCLIDEFKTAKVDRLWKETVPKLDNLVDLAQRLDDPNFLREVFLLTVLIRNSIRCF